MSRESQYLHKCRKSVYITFTLSMKIQSGRLLKRLRRGSGHVASVRRTRRSRRWARRTRCWSCRRRAPARRPCRPSAVCASACAGCAASRGTGRWGRRRSAAAAPLPLERAPAQRTQHRVQVRQLRKQLYTPCSPASSSTARRTHASLPPPLLHQRPRRHLHHSFVWEQCYATFSQRCRGQREATSIKAVSTTNLIKNSVLIWCGLCRQVRIRHLTYMHSKRLTGFLWIDAPFHLPASIARNCFGRTTWHDYLPFYVLAVRDQDKLRQMDPRTWLFRIESSNMLKFFGASLCRKWKCATDKLLAEDNVLEWCEESIRNRNALPADWNLKNGQQKTIFCTTWSNLFGNICSHLVFYWLKLSASCSEVHRESCWVSIRTATEWSERRSSEVNRASGGQGSGVAYGWAAISWEARAACAWHPRLHSGLYHNIVLFLRLTPTIIFLRLTSKTYFKR